MTPRSRPDRSIAHLFAQHASPFWAALVHLLGTDVRSTNATGPKAAAAAAMLSRARVTELPYSDNTPRRHDKRSGNRSGNNTPLCTLTQLLHHKRLPHSHVFSHVYWSAVPAPLSPSRFCFLSFPRAVSWRAVIPGEEHENVLERAKNRTGAGQRLRRRRIIHCHPWPWAVQRSRRLIRRWPWSPLTIAGSLPRTTLQAPATCLQRRHQKAFSGDGPRWASPALRISPPSGSQMEPIPAAHWRLLLRAHDAGARFRCPPPGLWRGKAQLQHVAGFRSGWTLGSLI